MKNKTEITISASTLGKISTPKKARAARANGKKGGRPPLHYYATQKPRGFANEVNVYEFNSRAERDAWVAQHRDDGDCNSASIGARECTRERAVRILRRARKEKEFYGALRCPETGEVFPEEKHPR